MKKMTRNSFKSLVFSLLASSFLLFSCTNDIDSASTTAGLDNSGDDSVVLNDNDGKSDKDTRKDYGSNDSGSSVIDFGDNFIRGFDASAVDYYENNVDGKGAVTYKDADGTTLDFFKILVNHGYDTVRLRIWVDPSQKINASDNPPVGDNTLERTISMAKRIKSAGLNLMLDFHYSDYWTDPSKQFVPVSWQNLSSAEEVSSKISEYTTEVLKSISDEAGIVPSHVQIGNEINNGLLLSTGTTDSKSDFAHAAGNTSENVKAYLAAASKAVRDFNGEIKIIVHVTSSNQPTKLLDTLKNAELDYDIIGLSYYPWEADHGTIGDMKNEVGNWKTTYGKPVMIAECSAQFDGDDNTVSKRNYSYQYMIDPDTSELYSDLTTETVSSTICVVGSVANAKAIVRHIMQETYDAGGIGCVAWGGEMHGDWDRAMFDWSGKAMDNIDAFNYKPSDGYPTENSSDGNSSDNTGGGTDEETMSIELTLAESIGATSVTLTYYDGENLSADSVTGAVSNNTVTLKVSNSYANEWAFENMKLEITGTNTDNLTMSSADSNFGGNSDKFWFKFESDSTLAVTVNRDVSSYTTLCEGKTLTVATASNYVSVLEANAFTGLSIGTLKVTISCEGSGAWASLSSKGSWANDGTYVQNCVNTTTTLTSSDNLAFVTALSTNGLYIQGSADSFTVTVTYAE